MCDLVSFVKLGGRKYFAQGEVVGGGRGGGGGDDPRVLSLPPPPPPPLLHYVYCCFYCLDPRDFAAAAVAYLHTDALYVKFVIYTHWTTHIQMD